MNPNFDLLDKVALKFEHVQLLKFACDLANLEVTAKSIKAQNKNFESLF